MEGDLCIENRNLQHRLTQKTLQRLIQAPQRKEQAEKMKDPVAVAFEEAANRSAAYKEGELIGVCEFSVSEQIWIIDHTGVRPAYGGQGIARRLVEKVIEEARARQIKILPLCSYASKMMEGKTEYQDVLVIR